MILLSLLLALVAPPNVVIVTIDTLRADHLRAYGHPTIETPSTDRLAREGVLVEDATVQAPWTRPSHASLFTGRHPWEHGVRDNASPPLGEGIPTLATLLRGRGYKTAAFIGSYVLASNAGLARGFDVYDEPFSDGRRGSKRHDQPERPAWEVVETSLEWLKGAGSGPFLAWVHLYDPHAPYTPPPSHARKYADHPYQGEVAYADAQVGRLLDFLDARKLRERTLFIVTSDHGEGLGDHGEDEHNFFLYDTALHVPLILSQPGVLPAGTRVRGQFRSVDLLPTVLELIAAPAVPTSGASRARELRVGARLPDNESASETLFPALHFGGAPVRALRAEGWKLIDGPRPELYDLREDPKESRNLIDVKAPMAAAMRDRLRAHDRGPVPVAGTSSGADPKDRIQEYQRFQDDRVEARRLFDAGQLDEALALLDAISKVGMASFDEQKLRGTLLLRKRRYQEAVESFEMALRMVPHLDQLYVDIAQAHLGLGRSEEAQAAIERGLRIEPASTVLLTAKGGLRQRLGDLRGARAVLEEARKGEPADARIRVQLGEVYHELGENQRAIEELRAATRLAPAHAVAWTEYGEVLAAGGRRREAIAAYRVALKRDSRAGAALLGLARVYLPDDPDAALPLLQRLVSLYPGFPGVGDALREARAAKAKREP